MTDSTSPRILVTGFEPFEQDPVNPSWEVARALHGEIVEGATGKTETTSSRETSGTGSRRECARSRDARCCSQAGFTQKGSKEQI